MKIGYLAATAAFRTETKRNSGLISRTKAFLAKLTSQQAAPQQEATLRQSYAGVRKPAGTREEHPYSTYEVLSSTWASEYNNP
ncbi:hypothetical protein HNQ91_000098 [Filimonas zeae]|uniref:Uncharacterized protein n=1 Tax=Filimonas zeae TaxID=1737353 RepID=A0A917IMC1_9BACT|nr:hypothetical protein [Filimonas zeae]MDR6337076.1 hypothetical protein [Filimonas zeae]GGH56889.1 hypothetical protein GCM10011379_00970 [Filimonas zeae]